MANDSLQALLTVRRRAVDEGRRALAESLDAAAAAAKAARAAELAITREMQRASATDSGDNLVEAFAVCRSALEAIEQLVASRRAEREAALAHQEQIELQDHMAQKPPA